MSATTEAVDKKIAGIMTGLGRNARAAAGELARATPAQKTAALTAAARAIREHQADILTANAKDMAAAKTRGLSGAMLDRLLLDAGRIGAVAQGIEDLALIPL